MTKKSLLKSLLCSSHSATLLLFKKPANVSDSYKAEILETADQQIEDHFLCFASDILDAENLLSSTLVDRLAAWAALHPMRQGRNQTTNFSQLVILFSPNGVYLGCLGELKDSETEELINLGVELVKAQGG